MINSKKIAVLGTGNGAHAMAAVMTQKGYEVTFYGMPGHNKRNMDFVMKSKTIITHGIIEDSFRLNEVTDDIETAIVGARYIMIVTPAFAHADYVELLKGRVSSDQVIMCFPGAFASLMFKKAFDKGQCPILIDTNDLPYTSRLEAPGVVRIHEEVPIRIGILSDADTTEIERELQSIFNCDEIMEDVLACGLSLINPAMHGGPCILNAGPIEYWMTNFYMYEQGLTPGAAKVNKALDEERRNIARKLGYSINPMTSLQGIDEKYTWKDLYAAIHGDIGLTPICGPNDLFSRYLTEDVSCALVPWAYIGRAIGIETPTIDAIINLYSIIHEKNWWEEGVSLKDLGIENMNISEIRAYCR